MEIKQFKHYILENNLPSFIILTGDEALLHIYLHELYQRYNLKKLNTIDDFLKNTKSKFKIDKEDTIYIIYDDNTFKDNNKYWNIQYKNLILVYNNLDKKDKLYKAFEPYIVYLEGLNDDLLYGVIKNRVNLNEEQINSIIKKCKSNYFKCLNEVEKISIFDKDLHTTLFNEFTKNHIFCKTDELETFDFVNSFTNRDKVLCLDLLNKVKKEDVLGLLTLIYNNLKLELTVKGTKQSAQELNINSKLHYVLSKKKVFTIEELCNILLNISDKLNQIKLGTIDSLDAMNLIILENL